MTKLYGRLGRRAAAVLCSLCTVAAVHAAGELRLTPEQHYQLALEAHTARQYRDMLGLLRQAAERGDVPAQEMLGSVLVAGGALYGASVPVDRCEAAHWSRQAALRGSEVGRHQLMLLSGVRDRRSVRDNCPGR